MEEVDNIIMESLKHLNCDFDENVRSIKDFNPDMVVDAIASCLEAITPGTQTSHKLPPSMSLRLKIASDLAERIKDLGFRGDMGYQSILYCNEVEVRRVLMFLIERIPRESGEVVPHQEIGYTPKLVKQIEEKVKLALAKPWVPAGFFEHGARDCGHTHIKQSYQHTVPLHTANIQVPNTQNEASEDLKQYWIHYLPDVTRQCSREDLMPSLLFRDSDFAVNNTNVSHALKNNLDASTNEFLEEATVKERENGDKTECETEIQNVAETNKSDKVQVLSEDIENGKRSVNKLKEEIKVAKAKLNELLQIKDKEETVLKDTVSQIKIKSKTLTVLSKEENLAKLKNMIDNARQRLAELGNQWKAVQTPLLEQCESLQHSLTTHESKLQEQQDKMKTVTEKNVQLMSELREKEKLECQLKEQAARFGKNTNRSAYTRRILEIIGNIKKQNEEIQKILKDTKEVQKDINNLNGQLDRSFTLSDELIFRNAKQDEMSRKAYKLLAALHSECGALIQAVTDLGLAERESRNFQEQVDAENGKDTEKKLKRVMQDLQEVKRETALLIQQIKV